MNDNMRPEINRSGPRILRGGARFNAGAPIINAVERIRPDSAAGAVECGWAGLISKVKSYA